MLITISAARITASAWAKMSIEDKADVVREARAADKEPPAAVRAWEKAATAWKSMPMIILNEPNPSKASMERVKKENESLKKKYDASRKLGVEYNKVMELAKPRVSSDYTPAKALKDGKLIRPYVGDFLLDRNNQGFPVRTMAAFERYKNSKDWYFDMFRAARAKLRKQKGPHKDYLMQVVDALANADMELQRQFMLGYYKASVGK